MDFSDFSEFIGPIIFGLIAWLSNYFGKKKKKDINTEEIADYKQENDIDFNQIFIEEDPSPEIIPEQESYTDINITEDIILEDNKIAKFPKEISPLQKNEEVSIARTPLKRFNKKSSLSRAASIRKKLRDKSSIKEAIIMKEILDRKY